MADTILLVDDGQLALKMQSDFFKDTTARIVTARNGLEALTIIKEQRVSLVFIDKQMPVMDGVTCCKLIKSDPKYRKLPVVMVTWDRDKESCTASGCDYFLAKPARREEILDIARRVLPQINRRRRRIPFKAPVVINHKSQRIECSLHNLSAGGAFIVTDRPVQINDLIEVSFALSEELRIRCFSEVAWTSEKCSSHPQGIGIRFTTLPSGVETELSKYIEVYWSRA